jgi:hypothetical protein
MRFTRRFALIAVLCTAIMGCWGSEGPRNINSGKDKPIPADKRDQKGQ